GNGQARGIVFPLRAIFQQIGHHGEKITVGMIGSGNLFFLAYLLPFPLKSCQKRMIFSRHHVFLGIGLISDPQTQRHIFPIGKSRSSLRPRLRKNREYTI
ncbi:MAG: hypothetical protein KJ699_06925, partial [Alphaproteobacteria bacterium]|nr:hypothetical protein [Alphaproteobacteria bacterium]